MSALNKFLISLAWLGIAGTSIAWGQARVWQDPSGRYQVEGTLVAADDKMIVIKDADGQLVVLKKEQLSTEDQNFLKSQAGASSTRLDDQAADGLGTPDNALPSEPADDNTAPGADDKSQQTKDKERLEKLRTEKSTWHLRDGEAVEGVLIGFGKQEFTILRREGDIWINGINSKTLPEDFERIVPAVVSEIDGRRVTNFEELEKHIAAGGGGPFSYAVAGVQLELEAGGVLTIPLALLESALASQLEAGFARWQAAQGEEVGEEDRYATGRRERLILASFERLRQIEAARERNLKLMELDLLGVNAGLTELWEVLLLPANPFGFPHSVVVPGRDSLTAQEVAAQAYPGWRVGPVRKLSN